MMISDEAVEAAAKAMFDQAFFRRDVEWTDVREEYCALVRPSLEAAAPHMLAEFEKQRKYDALGAISELGSDDPSENPYRSQA